MNLEFYLSYLVCANDTDTYFITSPAIDNFESWRKLNDACISRIGGSNDDDQRVGEYVVTIHEWRD